MDQEQRAPMSTATQRDAEAQHRLVERWMTSLAQLPAVQVIWLEGSLVDDRANPWSDIDLRVAVTDEGYAQLWETDRAPLLEALGEHRLLINGGFVRALTAEGIIAELLVLKASEIQGLELYEWKFLFHRAPDGPPCFKKLPMKTTAETWSGPPVSVEDVRNRTWFALYLMALIPPEFYRAETCSAAWGLEQARMELRQVMYQRLGIRFSKRAKELSQIFPPDFIEDLESSYTRAGQSALDPAAMAAAQVRTFTALGKHLQALSDQVGGGFEPEWYPRLLAKLTRDLSRIVGIELSQAP
jgi:hypothetical protein